MKHIVDLEKYRLKNLAPSRLHHQSSTASYENFEELVHHDFYEHGLFKGKTSTIKAKPSKEGEVVIKTIAPYGKVLSLSGNGQATITYDGGPTDLFGFTLTGNRSGVKFYMLDEKGNIAGEGAYFVYPGGTPEPIMWDTTGSYNFHGIRFEMKEEYPGPLLIYSYIAFPMLQTK